MRAAGFDQPQAGVFMLAVKFEPAVLGATHRLALAVPRQRVPFAVKRLERVQPLELERLRKGQADANPIAEGVEREGMEWMIVVRHAREFDADWRGLLCGRSHNGAWSLNLDEAVIPAIGKRSDAVLRTAMGGDPVIADVGDESKRCGVLDARLRGHDPEFQRYICGKSSQPSGSSRAGSSPGTAAGTPPGLLFGQNPTELCVSFLIDVVISRPSRSSPR